MADAKTTPLEPRHDDAQLAQRGERQGTEGGATRGEPEGGGQSAQTRPGGSAPGGQSPEQNQDQLPGSQGSGGAAERGMNQDPDQRRRAPGSQDS
jgi:hypothetical protein